MRRHRPVAGSNEAVAALRPVPLPLAQPPTSTSRPPAHASSGEFR
jgi:hypothetical protein